MESVAWKLDSSRQITRLRGHKVLSIARGWADTATLYVQTLVGGDFSPSLLSDSSRSEAPVIERASGLPSGHTTGKV